MSVQMLLDKELIGTEISLICSDILHHEDEKRGFEARLVGEGSIAGYKYGSIVYKNLISGVSRFNTNDTRIMRAPRQTHMKWASGLKEMATDKAWFSIPRG